MNTSTSNSNKLKISDVVALVGGVVAVGGMMFVPYYTLPSSIAMVVGSLLMISWWAPWVVRRLLHPDYRFSGLVGLSVMLIGVAAITLAIGMPQLYLFLKVVVPLLGLKFAVLGFLLWRQTLKTP